MLLLIVELSFAMTLLDGWLQFEPTVGNSESPQKLDPLFGL
jgi:hypothetical protein